MNKDAILTLLLVVAVSETGCARDPQRPAGPPPEAIAACATKVSADGCSFVDGYRSISGTCQQIAGSWVCVPDDHPPPRPGAAPPRRVEGAMAPGLSGASASLYQTRDTSAAGRPAGPIPPPEAFDACLQSSLGAECVVETGRGDVLGSCDLSGHRLACIPHQPPPPP